MGRIKSNLTTVTIEAPVHQSSTEEEDTAQPLRVEPQTAEADVRSNDIIIPVFADDSREVVDIFAEDEEVTEEEEILPKEYKEAYVVS